MDDLDQVLLVISEKLEKFLPLVGGPDHAHVLLQLFEALCDIEEVTVRNLAAASCSKVLKQLSGQHKTQAVAYFEMIRRMSNEESGEIFYSRVSACLIAVDLYPLLNDADKTILREIYGRLCKDELPIVRRAAMSVFMRFSALLDGEILVTEFLNLLKTLINDESQTIQVMAIESLGAYAILLKKSPGGSSILTNDFIPYVKQYSDDPSWKLRQGLARGYGTLAQSFAQAEVSSEIFPALIHMVLDPEPEVRTLAIQELLPYLEVVGTTHFVSELSPVAVQLADDPMVQVRKLLAELCVDVAAKVGPEAVALHLSDLIIRLMNDEDPLVRLRIIKRLHIIAEEAPSLCTRLTEALKSMFSNSNWRVRKGLVEAMPAVVKHMGQDYFVDHFLSVSLLLVKDGVEEVRSAACESLAKIANVINEMNWVYDRIFPTFKSLSTEDYLTRLTMITALQGFFLLDSIDSHERLQSEALTQLFSVTKDKVPNVRLRAAQALHAILSKGSNKINSSHKDQILSTLHELQSDKDKDVRYFATQVTRL